MQLNLAAQLHKQKKEDRKNSLLKRTPEWLDRETCAVSERKDGKNIDLTYYCPGCSSVKKCSTHTVYLGQSKKTLDQIQDIIAEKVQSKHGKHNHTHEAPQEPSTQRLQHIATDAKRKVAAMESKVATAELQVKKAKSAVQAQEQAQRLHSRATDRRVEISAAGGAEFQPANKSTAMLADGTGMVDSVKYWAEGSRKKALQLVTSLVKHFSFHDDIVQEFRLAENDTNAYIVDRIQAAIAVLKQCSSEEQREQYHVILTALAPEPGKRFEARVATAVGARRGGAPFKAAMKKRVEIDAAVVSQKKPLGVGDTVTCRHGEGTLVQYSSAQEPAAMEITHGDHKHTSRFSCASRGKGGGRIRHVPISFAPDPRAERCDVLCAALAEKVSRQHGLSPLVFTWLVYRFVSSTTMNAPLRHAQKTR
jgi:hypothetical protein